MEVQDSQGSQRNLVLNPSSLPALPPSPPKKKQVGGIQIKAPKLRGHLGLGLSVCVKKHVKSLEFMSRLDINLLIALYPEKVCGEIIKVVGSAQPRIEDGIQMPYTHTVIHEIELLTSFPQAYSMRQPQTLHLKTTIFQR